MKEIIEIGYALRSWLDRHNLDKEGARIVVELPNERLLNQAKCALKADATSDMMFDYEALNRGEVAVCGFGIAFRTKK